MREQDSTQDSEDVMRGLEGDGFPGAEPEPSEPGTGEFAAQDAAEPLGGERWWRLSGDVSITEAFALEVHRSTAGTKYQGLVGLRTRAGLQLDLALPREWKARA